MSNFPLSVAQRRISENCTRLLSAIK